MEWSWTYLQVSDASLGQVPAPMPTAVWPKSVGAAKHLLCALGHIVDLSELRSYHFSKSGIFSR